MKSIFIAIGLLVLSSNITSALSQESNGKNHSQSPYMFKTQLNELVKSTFYDKTLAPSYPKRTMVFVSLWPRRLRYVDEREETVQIISYVQLNWHDKRLATTPSNIDPNVELPEDFHVSNCSITSVDHNDIWMPALTSPEQSSPLESPFLIHMYALVDCYGNVQLAGYYNEETSCLLSMRYFPFDQQKCNFTIASRPDVHLRPTANRKALLQDFSPAYVIDNTNFDCGSWMLFASPGIINRTLSDISEKTYHYCDNCRNNSRSYITYKFVATRKSEQYILDWVVPPIMLGTTGVITIFLGCDAGERHSFGGTVVVTLTLMLGSLRDHMAVAYDGYPILAQLYLGFTATTVGATLLASLPRFIARQLRDRRRVRANSQVMQNHARNIIHPTPDKCAIWVCENDGKVQQRETVMQWKDLCELSIARYGSQSSMEFLVMGGFLVVQAFFIVWAIVTWLKRPVY